MRKLTIALTVLAAIAVPALAEAASQQGQITPLMPPVTTAGGAGSSSAAGKVAIGEITVNKRIDKASVNLFHR